MSRSRSMVEEGQGRSWIRNHKRSLLTSLFTGSCSLSFLTQSRSTCLGMVLPTVDQALLSQLPIKKMPHRLRHRLILWGQFFNWNSFFPGDSRLYQVNKTKTKSGLQSFGKAVSGWLRLRPKECFPKWLQLNTYGQTIKSNDLKVSNNSRETSQKKTQ